MEKTAIELFAGVSGFRCGLNKVTLKNNKVKENGNWTFVWTNQWEPATKVQDAFDCHVKRFGNENASNEDINKVDKKTIPDHTLLTGGFPCQDYSVAKSLSRETGIEGKKGVLWWDINDILKIKKPPFVLLENVDRLLLSPSKQRGKDFGIILRSFLDSGYSVEWRVINAADYGFPQKRRRTFIFASHKSTKYNKKLKKMEIENLVLKDSIIFNNFPIKEEIEKDNIGEIGKEKFTNLLEVNDKFKMQFYNAGAMINGKIYTAKVKSDCNKKAKLKNLIEKGDIDKKFFLTKEKIKKFEYLKGSKRIERTKPNGEKYFYSEGKMSFPDSLDEPARTLLTSEGGVSRTTHVIKDYKTNKLRLLTPLECERINGFPDNWTNTGMTDRKRNFMMGNALVVGVIEKLGESIEKIIEEEK